jgi:ABC-type transport system substrate-binding protein
VALALACLLAVAGCTPPGLPAPIAPSGPSAVAGAPPPAGTVVVGLDGTNGRIAGFNPYAIADFSPAAQAASSLVLPSTFVMTPAGALVPDGDVVDDAVVSSQDPFTVTYTLDREASWSDGTPVTAEDFSYLWAQMLVQPGTVNPAGYQLIEAIRSRNAGKTVEVQFSAPFPDWRTLFSPLLPSHLMKDFPGGWSAALANDLPVSANRYRMTSYDAVTGQITLARNDKYWAAPPGPAAVVLRLGDPADLLGAFERGDVQALWLAADGATAASMQISVPADRRVVIPQPATTQLIFNTTSGELADPAVRSAVAAAVNQPLLAVDLTAGWLAGGAPVASQVQLPSQLGGPSSPAAPIGTGDPAVARTDLVAAGYTVGGLYATRDGQVLRLTLGYPSGDPRLAAAARSIQRQLGVAGIEVDLLPDLVTTLVNSRIADGTTDLALITVPRGSSDSASAASAFGCPASSPLGVGSTATSTTEAFPTSTSQAAGSAAGVPDTTPATTIENPPTGTSSTPPEETPGQTTPADGGDQAPATGPPRTGNLSGFCTPGAQSQLVAALTGAGSVTAVDPTLWMELPVLPLLQPSTMFAVSDDLRTVLQGPHPGWTWTGPLSGLSGWPVG